MARIHFRRDVRIQRLAGTGIALVACLFALAFFAPRAFAQGGGGGTGNTDPASGVIVDADGVLQRTTAADPTGELARQRIQESLNRLDQNIARRSPLRKVSLNRLESAIDKCIAEGREVDDSMLHLAGITRLEYVFCYPETNDIVIAGPAEAWAEDLSGRYRGIETGRPVLELQDLVVALRAFPPGQEKSSPMIFCSIDPTPEGLTRMQQFLRQTGSQLTPQQAPDAAQFIVEGLRSSLGMQVITVGGVSPKTHFAQVLVEADYRMKLIGIGLEQPPVRLTSYVERANPAQISRNALQRWFFVPDYECVKVSEDALAMQMIGDGVKLIGEDEVVSSDGSRARSGGRGNRASEAFVRAFTKVYPKLAERAPVFAQLRNCIDMAVAAAFIQHQDYYGLVGWQANTFRDESVAPVETYNAPQQVATAVNSFWKGNTLLTPVGGGVQIRPSEAIDPTNLLDDEKGTVAQARSEIDLSTLEPGKWWWD
jgi:hypothetical protein